MNKNILTTQKEFYRTQATRSTDFRKSQLKKLKRVLKENESRMYEAIYLDFKKSEFDTYSSELALIYAEINDALNNLDYWSRTKRVGTNLLNFPAQSYIIPEPLGSCLVLGAWNYPYMLSINPAVAALAAGCTVVLKPSELPKNTSRVIAEMINDNFDIGFFHVIEGGVEETTELINQKWDKIFFTGSVPVGKIIYQSAAKNLVPVTLELGGKSPAIVDETCNMAMSVKRLVWGKFMNSGQTCISPDYVLVHKSVADQFVEQTIKEIEKSAYSFDNCNLVQIINQKNLNRLKAMIDPKRVVHGGEVNEQERYISPTVMFPCSYDDVAMQEEIFGPILPVIIYEDLDAAIQEINKREKPLAAYVFTKSKRVRKKVLSEISFGGGGVNETIMHIANSNLPHGGVGHSGLGTYHGEHGFRAFTHYKSIIDKPTWFELSLKYFPQTPFKLKIVKQIFRIK
ncbi:aldehyde dehydrogenase [Bacteroidia bacterium]|nr:aldehyde dehydrogenase [Bacteroidia bacterium]MDB9882875.1 aldehyde dehydrogenase [Bacteroidia bacterium]MDC1395406.1 aldehyde dehydrogenase [Bacteroidia bacterium]